MFRNIIYQTSRYFLLAAAVDAAANIHPKKKMYKRGERVDEEKKNVMAYASCF